MGNVGQVRKKDLVDPRPSTDGKMFRVTRETPFLLLVLAGGLLIAVGVIVYLPTRSISGPEVSMFLLLGLFGYFFAAFALARLINGTRVGPFPRLVTGLPALCSICALLLYYLRFGRSLNASWALVSSGIGLACTGILLLTVLSTSFRARVPCPACGHRVIRESVICAECGSPIDASPSTAFLSSKVIKTNKSQSQYAGKAALVGLIVLFPVLLPVVNTAVHPPQLLEVSITKPALGSTVDVGDVFVTVEVTGPGNVSGVTVNLGWHQPYTIPHSRSFTIKLSNVDPGSHYVYAYAYGKDGEHRDVTDLMHGESWFIAELPDYRDTLTSQILMAEELGRQVQENADRVDAEGKFADRLSTPEPLLDISHLKGDWADFAYRYIASELLEDVSYLKADLRDLVFDCERSGPRPRNKSERGVLMAMKAQLLRCLELIQDRTYALYFGCVALNEGRDYLVEFKKSIHAQIQLKHEWLGLLQSCRSHGIEVR